MQILQESIFISAIRTFFNTLLALIAIVIVALGVLFFINNIPQYNIADDKIQMEVLANSKGETHALSESRPTLLRIDFDGIIGDIGGTAPLIESYLRVSRTGMFKKGQIKGLLLHIDSPGGTAMDSDNIYRAIMAYKKEFHVPVYAFTPGLLASGGYFIACSADKIYASPSAIIGSVGVLMGPNFNFYGFMQKYGIDSMTLSAGKYKEKLPKFSEWPKGINKTASYDDLLNITKDMYKIFTDIVIQARTEAGMTQKKLVDEYGAQVYIANTAASLGYIDKADASYTIALADLAKTCNIPDDNFQVVRFYHERSPISDLFFTQIAMWLSQAKEILFGIKSSKTWNNKFLYYYDPNFNSL